MNERTHFFIKIYLSHFIRKGWCWLCATYWPKVLLTIAALLSHSGWAAQPWVTEGPSPLSGAGSYSGILSPTDSNWTWTDCNSSHLWHLVIFLFDAHLLLWAYASTLNSTMSTGQGDILISSTGCTCFAVLLLIYTGASLDWQPRVNMLQSSHTYFSKLYMWNFSSCLSPSPSHTHFTNNTQGQQ